MLCISGDNGDTVTVVDFPPSYAKMLPAQLTLSVSTSTTSKSVPVTSLQPSECSLGGGVTYGDGGGEYRGFLAGILGCFKPVWTIIGKATAADLKQQGI